MDFRQLQYFKAAFECRTMSGAARACRVTQPTLSAQIKRLELELDETLFGRTAVGLEPTSFANDLHRTFGPVLDRAADGMRTIRSGTQPTQKIPDDYAEPAPLPNTRQLRYFAQVFEDGSISRAASRLNVVQPAISMQIRALEEQIGGLLFERTKQGVFPTDLGRKVYAIYAPILDELKTARRRSIGNRPRPMLRVGILPGLDEDSLLVRATTTTIVEWGKQFSGVELKVVESHSGVLLDWLSDNIIDVAIVEDLHARIALRETLLSSEPLAILTSTSYSVCPPGPITLSEIGNLNLVMPSKRHGLRALMDRAFEDAGMSLTPRLELDSMASAIRLVKSGGWATVMPPSAVERSLQDHLLVAHPIVKPSITRNLRAVQLPRRRNQQWETTFIRMLRQGLTR